jgi:hypothetical protein
VVKRLNASLRGWVGYFHYRNSSKVLGKVKTSAEDRLRNHLMKRYKIRNRGEALQRFPRQKAVCGLWALQSADDSALEISACRGVKNIGKPCALIAHARFDEGGQGYRTMARLIEAPPDESSGNSYA